jgi:hypothetical protein
MPKNLNLYGTNKRQIVRFNKDFFFKKHFSILEIQWDGADFWQHFNKFYPRPSFNITPLGIGMIYYNSLFSI